MTAEENALEYVLTLEERLKSEDSIVRLWVAEEIVSLATRRN